MKYFKNNEEGIALVFTLLTFLVLAVLGTALMTIGVANVKLTKTTTQHESTFYIAEGGVNQSIAILEKKAKELGAMNLSHDDFFNQLEAFIDGNIKGELDIFEENAGEEPIAVIDVTKETAVDQTVGNYSQRSVRYTLGSTGQQGSADRTVSSSFDVTHRIEISSGNAPSDFVFYSASNKTLSMPNDGYFEGDFFAEEVIFESAGSKILGSIIATQLIDIRERVEVTGSLYALNGNVYLNNSNAVVGEDIYAMGDVTLTHGSEVNNIFSDGEVQLKSNSKAESIHAKEDVLLESGVRTGSIYSGGAVSLNDSNINVGPIHANGSVYAKTSSNLSGIFTNGRFTFGSNITVNGDIHALGDVGEENKGTSFTVNGNIFGGSNVYTNSYNTFKITEDVYAAGDLIHGTGNMISGDVKVGGKVKKSNNNPLGTINGQLTENAIVEEIISPQAPSSPVSPDFSGIQVTSEALPLKSFTPGETSITSNQTNTVHHLTSSDYDRLNLSYQDELYLSSGDYHFNDFTLSSGGVKVYLDLSGGPINLYSKNNISLSYDTTFYISEDGTNYTKINRDFVNANKEKAKEYAGQLYFEAQEDFYAHNDLTILGTVLADNNFTTSSSVTFVGMNLVNNGEINVGNAPTMIYAPPSSSAGGNPGSGSNTNGSNFAPVEITINAPVTEL